ncbi:MAG TPA: hypothetical protein PKD91_07305 [Bacteroidia bacterium]|nr:hypothetical protein [Bacteroidia bacterium]
MKKLKFIALIIIGTLTGLTFSSSRLSAQDKKMENKKDQTESIPSQNATAEEWKVFKAETEAKIEANDARIAELKIQKKNNDEKLDESYVKRVDVLEVKNKELKDRVDAYEKKNSDWAKFKREFNHDLDELGQAFKDMLVDNKM